MKTKSVFSTALLWIVTCVLVYSVAAEPLPIATVEFDATTEYWVLG